MNAQFICHPDFADVAPIHVYHKERQKIAFEAEPPYRNRHILFRKKQSIVRRGPAILRISADDYYKLYINGRFVAQGPAPSYPSSYYYNELDVTEFLREGENLFAVHTYYQGLINRVWVSGDRRQMLWCSLLLDGEEILVSDTDWLCHDHTGYTECGIIGYDTQFAERYDSRSPEDAFFLPEFDDSAWGSAAVAKHADYQLRKQPTSVLDVYETEPVSVTPTDGGMRIDLGREMAGNLIIEATGTVGETVILRYGEELNEDGSVRYDMRCNCLYEEQWILSGKTDVLRFFDYKAFRYAELILPEGIRIGRIAMQARHYPFEQVAKYTTDNEALKQVLALCADTIHYGVQELFVDCPTREKGQYLGDVCVSARAQALLTGKTDLLKKALRDFFDSSFICPGIMAVSSSSLMQEIADYSLLLPALVCWTYALDGDKAFLAEAEPYLTGVYEYFLRYRNESGLLENVTEKWNLVDWPKNLRDGYDFPLTKPIGPGVHNVLNAFWCGFLDAMDEYYGLIGKAPTGLTASTKKVFYDTFYSEKTGLFCDAPDTEHAAIHSNVLPLLFEIGTEDASLRARIFALIREKRLTSMGVYMSYFTLAALKKHGQTALAEELACDEGCWLNMLREGATATFEAWGKDQKWNTSLCHPWATAPVIVFADGVRVY